MAGIPLMNAYANGTIKLSTIVIPDSTHANSCKAAADGNTMPLGVSSDAARLRPDPDISALSATALDNAAITGEPVRVYGLGSVGVPLYCNYAWSPGDLIMADASAYGILCTSGKYYVGRAEGVGVVGTFCPITVSPGLMY